MTLRECYDALGGDYEGVIGRMSLERIVQKFTIKFIDDKSFPLLKESLENENYEEAFRAAHTLKGVCQNLSFDKLYKSSYEMTELLRAKKHSEAKDYFSSVNKDYAETVSAIESFRQSNGL